MGTHLFKQWLFVRVLAVLHHCIHIRIHMHIYVRNPNHRIGYTCIYIIILQYVFLKIVLHYIVIHKNKSYRVTFVLFLIVQFYCAVVLMALFHCLVLFLN